MMKSVFIICFAILFSFGAANKDQRVINGTDAVKSEFPWAINMVNISSSNPKCGGAIINQNWVLTAAHCVAEITGTEIQLIAGDHNHTDSDSAKQKRNVSQLVVHPKYLLTDTQIYYDFALLRVSTPFQLSDTVKKVNLPHNASVSVNGGLTLAGWGVTNIQNQTFPDILQKVNLTIIPHLQCKDLYNRIYRNITDEKLCAGANHSSPCNHDSGSGLVQITRDPLSNCKVHVIYGIVSFGHPTCAGGMTVPAVFGYVPYVVDWVRQIAGEPVPTNPTNTTCDIGDNNNSNILNINFGLFFCALGLSFTR